MLDDCIILVASHSSRLVLITRLSELSVINSFFSSLYHEKAVFFSASMRNASFNSFKLELMYVPHLQVCVFMPYSFCLARLCEIS